MTSQECIAVSAFEARTRDRGSTTWMRTCLLKMAFTSLEMHQVSWSPLWIPKLWQRHLCPWIEGKWLFLRSNMDKGNLICPSYWHQTSILIFKSQYYRDTTTFTYMSFFLLFIYYGLLIYIKRGRERLVKVKVTQLFVIPWAIRSVDFSKPEYSRE